MKTNTRRMLMIVIAVVAVLSLILHKPLTEAFAETGCYGAKSTACNTCDDVIKAYRSKNWAFDVTKFEQCKSAYPCYGVKPDGTCRTCASVVNAYKTKNWGYNPSSFAQCRNEYPCYGAKPDGTCVTCDDVVNGYKAKNWGYDMKQFKQCIGK